MNFLSRLLIFSACALLGTHATAQPFPSKPIRMIAPSSPGGPVDVIARVLAPGMTETLGQQVIVENRAGAAGLIGAELVAKAPADGYTLLLGFSGPLAIVPHLNEATPYDPVRDFAPVTLAASAPYVLLVHPAVPVKSVKELVALAKSRPGKLNYASGGNGTGIHMAGELFNLAAGVRILHVPYKGAGPGMAALMSGETDMMFNGLSPAIPQMKSGRLRGLAVGGDKRSPLMPELPTVAESGLKFNTTGWYGILAPRGTPQPVIAKLQSELARALSIALVKEQLTKMGVEGIGSTPEQFGSLIREEMEKWGKVIKTAGLKGMPL